MYNKFKVSGHEEETRKAAEEAQRKLKENNVEIMDVETFQKRVLAGEISDDTGSAELIINGSASNYHIYIDRRCVTKSDGSLITYAGILKMYKPEELQVKYTKRPRRMRTVSQYKQMMQARDAKERKSNYGQIG